MRISDFLSPADVLVDARASDKPQLLRDLSQRAGAACGISTDVIVTALAKREGLGSTGLGNGVAVPHARLAGVKRPYGILVRLRRAIDFDAIDGQPVDVVFLLLMPDEKAAEQLNALASVARILRGSQSVGLLRKAPDAAALYSIMVAATR